MEKILSLNGNVAELEKVRGEGKLIKSCLSICPSCDRIIPADLIRRGEYTHLKKFCLFERKEFEAFICKGDSRMFANNWRPVVPRGWPYFSFKIGDRFKYTEPFNVHNILYVLLVLTNQCNANCKICYQKNEYYFIDSFKKEMSLAEIEKRISPFKNKLIVLFGGEPTLREDLPEIIKLIRVSGNIPLLFTNGIKLSNRGHLKVLKNSGLRKVCISFDGFKPKIYSELRGNYAEVYSLKMLALSNLRKEGIMTSLQMTVVKDTNGAEIPEILQFCAKNDFIQSLWLRKLYLQGQESCFGIDKSQLLSEKEIESLVCDALSIEKNYFELWDELKIEIIAYLSKKFPTLEFSMIELGKIYLLRKNGKLSPLFSAGELGEIIKAFKQEKLWLLLKPKYLRWGLIILKNAFFSIIFRRLLFSKAEKDFFKKNVFKVVMRDGMVFYPNFVLFEKTLVPKMLYYMNETFALEWMAD